MEDLQEVINKLHLEMQTLRESSDENQTGLRRRGANCRHRVATTVQWAIAQLEIRSQ